MRYIAPHISNDLKKKMVFVGGPRQVGKTTMAKAILDTSPEGGRYFNWDYDEDRRDIISKRWHDTDSLLVFDELHKYPRWKSWIKGIYDVSHERHSFLVTGSARLDIYRRGGDSLMGRYHYWRLHPFSLDECPVAIAPEDAYRRLMTVGGFPEPFLDGDEREAQRWRKERFDRVLREDIRDLEPIRNIQLLGMFLDALRHRVGGLITLSNLAGEIQVSPKTAKAWLELLERMYLVFAVWPYTRSLPRAILKPPKVFFFDNADVIGDEGARFENLVATHLLKRLHYLEDREGHRCELRYLRDKEGREIDFVILKNGEIQELIEAKHTEENVSRSLRYYVKRLRPKKATQIVANLKKPYSSGIISVTNPLAYFSGGFFGTDD